LDGSEAGSTGGGGAIRGGIVKRHKGDRNRERRGSENGYGGDQNGYGGERKRKDRKRRYHVEFVVSQLQRERKCSEKGKVNFINFCKNDITRYYI
jgi:hypothetical protein